VLRFSRLPRFARSLVTLFFVAAFLSPLQFVAIAPGNPQGIFPEIVSLSKKSKATSYPVDGQFYLLTIRITAPGSYVPGIEMLYRWARTDNVVLPTSVIYPPGVTSEEEEKQSTAEMKGSQDYARTIALKYLVRTYPDRGFEKLTTKDISIEVKRTGGPSGGMIFTLAIIELLTKENLLKGRSIAGTGTIEKDGSIGAIGGIEEKIVAAKRAGVDLFLAPAANCSELPSITEGITVAAVATIDEAIAALNSKSPKGCATLGA
jgi:PDZ domain-containing protein